MRQFVRGLEDKALGMRVVKGVSPDQQLVKVVHDQLVELMGGTQKELVVPNDGPQVRGFDAQAIAWQLHLLSWLQGLANTSVKQMRPQAVCTS